MKRLIIDDERNFIFPADDFIVYARSSEEALYLLESGEHFDEVWLDGDLGEDDDIAPVYHYIEHRAGFEHPLPVGGYVIHTQNPVWRELLVRMFLRWGLPYKHCWRLPVRKES